MQVVDWQIIIEKHGAIVWQTAYRLLGNYTDTSDCFQETFISALKLCKHQKVNNFPALLARLATTRAIDMLRVRFRLESNNSINDYNVSAPNDNPDPAKDAQKQELAMQLKKALVQLPVQESQVFCLRYLNDMSYRQPDKTRTYRTILSGFKTGCTGNPECVRHNHKPARERTDTTHRHCAISGQAMDYG